jgi:hypothetical protein
MAEKKKTTTTNKKQALDIGTITSTESSDRRIAAILALARGMETLAQALNRPDVEVKLAGNLTCRDMVIGGKTTVEL